MCPLDQAARVTEGQRDNRRFCSEGGLEGLIVQKRHYMVNGKGLTGELPHLGYLPLDTLGGLEDGSDAYKAACLGYRGHKL